MMLDHDAVKAELSALAAKNQKGVILPSDVVEKARDESSAMHSYFTWDDSEAAKRYRLDQARALLRVYIVRTEANEAVQPIRAFVSLSTDRVAGGGYRPVATVLSSEELRRQMVRDAVNELRVVQRKYNRVKELEPVFVAVDRVEQEQEESAAGTRSAA